MIGKPNKTLLQMCGGEMNRSDYIGSSDCAAILGVSPWRTQLDVFLDKTRGAEPTTPEKNKIFERGKRLEPYVLDMLREEEGLHIVATNQRHTHPDYGFLAGEVDAEFFDKKLQSTQNIEIKTTNFYSRDDWGDIGSDAIPVHYTAQAMHNLMLTGRKVCIFGVLLGVDDFRVYRVERDNDLCEHIKKTEVDFWQKNILANKPPATVNTSDVLRLFNKDNGILIRATPDLIEQYNRLKELRDNIKELESQRIVIEDAIKVFIGEATGVELDGKPIITYKTQSARRLDANSLKNDNAELYELYTKTTQTRVLRIK